MANTNNKPYSGITSDGMGFTVIRKSNQAVAKEAPKSKGNTQKSGKK